MFVLCPGHRRTNLLLLDDSMFAEETVRKKPASESADSRNLSVHLSAGLSSVDISNVSARPVQSRPPSAQLKVDINRGSISSTSSCPSSDQLTATDTSPSQR